LKEKVDKKGNPSIIGIGFVIEKDMEIREDHLKHNWKERWFVVQSYAHAARQKKALMERINNAQDTLAKLKPKTGESRENFRERAEQILKKYCVFGLIEIEIIEFVSHKKRYTKRGRPTSNISYELLEIRQLKLSFCLNQSAIEENQALAGWRIYVTNTSEETMTLEQSIRYYRDEWLVERSFHRFKKGKLPVLPLFLRIPERIEGLMLLLVIALQVFTLMEFVIRRELAQQEETLAGLVPGNPSIKTARPTAERIISQFDDLHLIITETKKCIKGRLLETLTPLQQRILELLRIPLDIYKGLSFNQLIPS
jgi:transposase